MITFRRQAVRFIAHQREMADGRGVLSPSAICRPVTPVVGHLLEPSLEDSVEWGFSGAAEAGESTLLHNIA